VKKEEPYTMRLKISDTPVSASMRLLICGVVSALYLACFPWAHDVLGEGFVDLAALPLAAIAGCWGVVVGVIAAPVVLLACAGLLILAGGNVTAVLTLPHVVLFIALGYGFGTMHELLRTSREKTVALEASETALRTVVTHAPVAFWATDASGRFTIRAGEALRRLGFSDGQHVGRDAREFFESEYPDHPELVEHLDRALGGETVSSELYLRGRALEASHIPVRTRTMKTVGVVGVAFDVTERVRAEHDLRASEARLDGIVRSAKDAIITVDAAGAIIIFNTAAELMFGRMAQEMIGQSLERLLPQAGRVAHAHHVQTFLKGDQDDHEIQGRQLTALRANGEQFPIEATLSLVVVDGEKLATVIVRDITERRKLGAALERRALYDDLTDLPNRALFDDRLDHALVQHGRDGLAGAVLMFDVDNFQDTNETFGHAVGDQILKTISTRFRDELRDTDTLARLGGDEFAIVLAGVDERATRDVARRLLRSLEQSVEIGDRHVDVGVSIGVALYPKHGVDRQTLLQSAQVAMNQARRTRRTSVLYASQDDRSNACGLDMVSDLRAAIASGAIQLAFQPEVDMSSGKALRVEALARWTHPDRGPIPPDQFVALAERTGLIGLLTASVLDQAIAQAAQWRRAGIDLPVAVNLSVQDVLDHDLPFRIQDLLRKHDLPATSLSVEVTESVLMIEVERAVPSLATLRSIGVDIAIDDFGSGYSSLMYLARLPADRIKIDRSFIRVMREDRGARAITRAAITLAHDLKLSAVAEGVEGVEEWALLRDLGCDSVQGYYISRPLAPAVVPQWLSSYGVGTPRHAMLALLPATA
jgi:diguanylate cyclase (GGDEF)-like protein/PAS domain S-box-containing protein